METFPLVQATQMDVRQMLTRIIFHFLGVCSASCTSLAAPTSPARGATATLWECHSMVGTQDWIVQTQGYQIKEER